MHPEANFPLRPKDAQGNSTPFNINVITEGDRGKRVSNEKPTKNENYGGSRRKQMSTPHFIYENDALYWVILRKEFLHVRQNTKIV